MQETQQLMSGMDAESMLEIYSETEQTYKITFHVGRAEAARLQSNAGTGAVTNDGYVRTTNGDFLATLAGRDKNATVEVIDE